VQARSSKRFAIMLRDTLLRVSPWTIIGVAVLTRLLFSTAWALWIDIPQSNVPVAGETYYQAGADGYIQIARTLVTSGRYAFSPDGPAVHNRPPIQPLVFVVFGAWSADHWFLFWLVGSAFLWLICLSAIHRMSVDLAFSPLATRATLLAIGFHPYLIFISKTHTFINAAIAVLPVALWLFLRIPRNPIGYGLATGLACGIAALTHGTFLLLAPVLSVLLCFRTDVTPGKRIQAASLCLLVTVALIAPWTLRNYQTFDQLIPVVTGNGFHYWKGDAVYFGGQNRSAELLRRETGRELSIVYFGAENPADDRVLWGLAMQDMRERPLRLIPRILIGVSTFWAPSSGLKYKAMVSALLNWPLLLALFVLLGLHLRRRTLAYHQIVIVVVSAYLCAAFSFFVASASYFNMLLSPMLLLLVSVARQAKSDPQAL
jgi:hypothetical protein